jgi:hypothetical protein
MIVKCSKCGGQHPSWECTKPQKKSTEAAKPDSAIKRVGTPAKGLAVALSPSGPVGSPSKPDRHKPGYMAEYMRNYRKRVNTPKPSVNTHPEAS